MSRIPAESQLAHQAEVALTPVWVPRLSNWLLEGTLRIALPWNTEKHVHLVVSSIHEIDSIALELCSAMSTDANCEENSTPPSSPSSFTFHKGVYVVERSLTMELPGSATPSASPSVKVQTNDDGEHSRNPAVGTPPIDALTPSTEDCDMLELDIAPLSEPYHEEPLAETAIPGLAPEHITAQQQRMASRVRVVSLSELIPQLPKEWQVANADAHRSKRVFARICYKARDSLLSLLEGKRTESSVVECPQLFTSTLTSMESTEASLSEADAASPSTLAMRHTGCCFTFLSSQQTQLYACPKVVVSAPDARKESSVYAVHGVCPVLVSQVACPPNGSSRLVLNEASENADTASFAMCISTGKYSNVRLRIAVLCVSRNGEVLQVCLVDEGKHDACVLQMKQAAPNQSLIASLHVYLCDADEEELLSVIIACYGSAAGEWIQHLLGSREEDALHSVTQVEHALLVTGGSNAQLSVQSRGVRLNKTGRVVQCSASLVKQLRRLISPLKPASTEPEGEARCLCLAVGAEVSLVSAFLECFVAPLYNCSSHVHQTLVGRSSLCRAWAFELSQHCARVQNNAPRRAALQSLLAQELVLSQSGSSIATGLSAAFLSHASSSAFRQYVQEKCGLLQLVKCAVDYAHQSALQKLPNTEDLVDRIADAIQCGAYCGFSPLDLCRTAWRTPNWWYHVRQLPFFSAPLTLRWSSEVLKPHEENDNATSHVIRLSLTAPPHEVTKRFDHDGSSLVLSDPFAIPFCVLVFVVRCAAPTEDKKAAKGGSRQKRRRGSDAATNSKNTSKSTTEAPVPVSCTLQGCVDGIWNAQPLAPVLSRYSGRSGGGDVDACSAMQFTLIKGESIDDDDFEALLAQHQDDSHENAEDAVSDGESSKPAAHNHRKDGEIDDLLRISERALLRSGLKVEDGVGNATMEHTSIKVTRTPSNASPADAHTIVVPVVLPLKKAVPLVGQTLTVDHSATLREMYPQAVVNTLVSCCAELCRGGRRHHRSHSHSHSRSKKPLSERPEVLECLGELVEQFPGGVETSKESRRSILRGRTSRTSTENALSIPRRCCATSLLFDDRTMHGVVAGGGVSSATTTASVPRTGCQIPCSLGERSFSIMNLLVSRLSAMSECFRGLAGVHAAARQQPRALKLLHRSAAKEQQRQPPVVVLMTFAKTMIAELAEVFIRCQEAISAAACSQGEEGGAGAANSSEQRNVERKVAIAVQAVTAIAPPMLVYVRSAIATLERHSTQLDAVARVHLYRLGADFSNIVLLNPMCRELVDSLLLDWLIS